MASEATQTTIPSKLGDAAPKTVELPDGTQVPLGHVPGLSDDQMQSLHSYLQANPDQAMASLRQAQALFAANPQMASYMAQQQLNMAQLASEDSQKKLAQLSSDPELESVFEDIRKQGPQALQKYWSDPDVLSKIGKKLQEVQLDLTSQTTQVPTTTGNLHGCAKKGDVENINKLLKEGHDINQQDARGITPVGVAVGFNKIEAVKALVDHGADLDLKDKQGNTILHYATGYGRKEIAELLLERGMSADEQNNAKQTPRDVAKMNGETHMIKLLSDWGSKSTKAKA